MEQQRDGWVHVSYLFLHRLKLFIIHSQIDQHSALIGAVERQVWICTCEIEDHSENSNQKLNFMCLSNKSNIYILYIYNFILHVSQFIL